MRLDLVLDQVNSLIGGVDKELMKLKNALTTYRIFEAAKRIYNETRQN